MGERKTIQTDWPNTPEAAAAREQERKRVFKNYLGNLDLSNKDLEGKDILDVGAGRLAGFADRARQLGHSSRVVSLDIDNFSDISDDKIDQGKNVKLGNIEFGKDNLKEKLGAKEEPKFDLILSHDSTPYTIVNEGEHIFIDESGVKRENLDLLRQKIKGVIRSALDHLKTGGRAVFYPVFRSEVVDFKEGGVRDFQNWRKILDEVLEEEIKADPERGYDYHIEDAEGGPSKREQRLIIKRKF